MHRLPERRTQRAADALDSGRMEHPAQIWPDYATKAFNNFRQVVCRNTDVFAGLSGRQLPTLHEIRAYQKGHARKVLRVNMMLPFSVTDDDSGVREESQAYAAMTARVA